MNPVSLSVKPDNNKTFVENVVEDLKIEFKSVAAEQTFDYLSKCFKMDYQRRIPRERSGWRTLMDVVREGKVSKHSVYDSAGRHGHTVAELDRNGLVEIRVFEGERGRGGKILKIRVAVDKQNVQKEIEKREKFSI